MLIFVRRKGRHNDTMEQTNGKPRRHFTPQQKYDILKDIERCAGREDNVISPFELET